MGEYNTSSNTMSYLVCSLLITVIIAPIVSASGGGAVIDVSSIQLDEMGTFEDSELNVPFTIVEQSGIDADVEVNVIISSLEGVEIHNQSTNYTILASGSTPINYTFANMPFGFSNLVVTMSGDTGTVDSNYVTQFNRTIQRLRPALLSIEEVSIIPVDFMGTPTGNESIRDGDYVMISAEIENLGDIQWSSDINVDIIDQDLFETHVTPATFNAASTTIIQTYSSSQFTESSTNISSHISVNVTVSVPPPSQNELFQVDTFEVGPPPLARIDMELLHLNSEVNAGGVAMWNLSVANNGERDFNGTVTCIFTGGEVEYSSTIGLSPNNSIMISISASARPGVLSCQTEGQRIWNDSISPVYSTLSMTAAAFEAAGSATPATLGGPWHKGDIATFSMLVRNHGDSDGVVQLRCEINGVISLSEPLNLAIDAAGEVSVAIQMTTTGQNQVNWSLVSSDGAIDSGLKGIIQIPVSAQQSIEPKINLVEWDSAEGISFTWQVELDVGVERDIRLRLGFVAGGSESYPYDSVITVYPGMTAGQFDVGHVDADMVVISIDSINWTLGPGPTSATKSVPSERPVYSIQINPLSTPRDPTAGDETSIVVEISNDGVIDGISGQLLLVDASGNLLAQSDTDILLSGDSEGVILSIVWPSGADVKLTAKWSIGQEIITSSQSFTSGTNEASTQSYEIPWIGMISGIAIAGAVILAFRLKNTSKEVVPKSHKNKNNTSKPKKKSSKSKSSTSSSDRKVQVGCPECARQLRVPASYSGKVRCPDCSNRFDVTSREESDKEDEIEEIIEQEKKEIACPDCAQSLRVPTDYSGSVRCPACKVVFSANSE